MQAIKFTRIITAVVALFVGFRMHSQIESSLKWKSIEGVSIPIPPSEHPRLFLRNEHIPELKERMQDPILSKVWDDLVAMSKDSHNESAEKKDWRYYLDQKGIPVKAELDALRYLISDKESIGRLAIKNILKNLKKSNWPEEGNDLSRGIGRRMVSGAIVYDWCYDLLTKSEKEAFIKEFLRLAEMLECGYPPRKVGLIVGHPSEWMIMRDLLSTSIAIYDEHPDMYNIIAKLLYEEFKPPRDWFFKGHAHHQGTAYYNVRHANELFAQWIFNRMGAGNFYHPSQQFVPYNILYLTRPDGQFVASGDTNYYRKKPNAMGIVALLNGSYYKDEFINKVYLDNPSLASHNKLFEFLWRDVDLGTREVNDLPLSRYFDAPFGWMVARTSWDENAVIAEMKINEYHFGNHQHLDAGSFQIYYKGPLAIDSGIYSGVSDGISGYNNSHNKNYFKRTIAHNSLLVYDPKEEFLTWDYGGAHKTKYGRNDGGQRMPGKAWTPPNTFADILTEEYKTGEIIAHGFGPDNYAPEYTYLKGDIASAYTDKVEEAKRSFVFLNFKEDSIPAGLIVFDKLVSSNPDFKKYWLLHSIEEPTLRGTETTISRTLFGESGKLICNTILPKKENLSIELVGGPGKEFWVFGENLETIPRDRPDPANDRGAWRVEVSPLQSAKENYFLNVLQVTDTEIDKTYKVKEILGDEVFGVQIKDRIVLFNKRSSQMDLPFSFSVKEKGNYKFLITDVEEGTWQIKKNGKVLHVAIRADKTDNVLYFEGSHGDYEVIR
ncbi:DUF4962 domain-containing protein [Tamlana fucoidanivorans]|uniref:DUF4962 domain-containing protein n=1 Tax=Allotamlana fucoidanivorans TaxID=2583814 RepID=A0A5C4SQX4_9FLAO|nr:heparin/heparin-sulfate lyase HepB [Tamlana fucoidanivorans]TNJ46037.1 DUF4962 domain-containing protein [Tamlana fucoidanivorans]